MLRIARNLWLATNVRISNVWLFETGSGRFLIDTGHPVERPALLVELWRAGVRRPGDLDGVILTHRHSDHAGNAAWLRERFRCPVICHAADAPLLAGKERPAPLARRIGWFYE
ncbi:MAG: MBL fold metallo-hydrolase, partial [Planctomycetota bacterium]